MGSEFCIAECCLIVKGEVEHHNTPHITSITFAKRSVSASLRSVMAITCEGAECVNLIPLHPEAIHHGNDLSHFP